MMHVHGLFQATQPRINVTVYCFEGILIGSMVSDNVDLCHMLPAALAGVQTTCAGLILSTMDLLFVSALLPYALPPTSLIAAF